MTTPPNIGQQPTPPEAYRYYANRPRTGIYFHHTAGSIHDSTPLPKMGASWQKIFRPNGDILNAVPEGAAAHCVLMTDLFVPTWQMRCPDAAVSDANYSADSWEIQYAPQAPYLESPTPEQYESIAWALRERYAQTGPVPVLGHGQVQSDKLRTEPTYFDYIRVGLGPMNPGIGRFLLQSEEPMNPADDETIKGWLETLGVQVNMDTALMKLASEAFRNGPPPVGYWRGAALPAPDGVSGEYDVINDQGQLCKRHRFEGGIAEFNTVTGGLGWVQIVSHPDQINAQEP